jgi:hypothetical protein
VINVDALNSRYPSYNVLDRLERWDSHTKEIVRRRVGPFEPERVLSVQEASCLAQIAKHIIYDDRNEIITWIVHHVDEKLNSGIGENQRDLGVKPEKQFIIEGLKALQHLAKINYQRDFTGLTEQEQFALISKLQKGENTQIPSFQDIPQKKLFKKLVGLIVEAYYSHPTVWSEIGYGGPVYPDVYVRVELGLTDPWEAKRVGE